VVNTRGDYYDVFHIYLPIACAVYGVILLLVLYAVIFRRRRPPADQRTKHTKIEAPYALLLVVTAAFLVALTFSVEAKEDRVTKAPGVEVDVTAAQWNWRFHYPRYGVTTTSSAAREGAFAVPANTPLHFRLTSADVIHAFYVPGTRFKRDAFPGSETAFDLSFSRTGTYLGECAEYCGYLHSNMQFEVRVLSPAAFRAWASAQRR
jgi:cytochrome c oxidase subunit II